MRGVAVVLLIGCRINFDPMALGDGGSSELGGEATVDIPGDLPTGQFSAPMTIPGLDMLGLQEEDVTGSSTKLELLLGISIGNGHLYTVTRADEAQPFGAPVVIPELMAGGFVDSAPRLTPDDHTIYFASSRAGGMDTMGDIWTATRTAIGQPWSTPTNLAPVNSTLREKWFAPCNGGHYVLALQTVAGDDDMFEGTLGGSGPTAITSLNTVGTEGSPYLTADCLTLFYAGDTGIGRDLLYAQRTTVGGPWGTPVPITELNSPTQDADPWLSPDGRMVVFASARGGSMDVYIATR